MHDKELLDAVKKHYHTEDAGYGKGGIFVKGVPWISIAQARKITGIKGKERECKPRQKPWGDYATVAMLNQPRSPRITPKFRRLA